LFLEIGVGPELDGLDDSGRDHTGLDVPDSIRQFLVFVLEKVDLLNVAGPLCHHLTEPLFLHGFVLLEIPHPFPKQLSLHVRTYHLLNTNLQIFNRHNPKFL
jgi:hypothetical protein